MSPFCVSRDTRFHTAANDYHSMSKNVKQGENKLESSGMAQILTGSAHDKYCPSNSDLL